MISLLSWAVNVTRFSPPPIALLFSRDTWVIVGISLSTMISCSTEATFPAKSVAETFRVYCVWVLLMAVPLPVSFFEYCVRSMVILKGASLSSPTFESSKKASTLLMPLASWASISISMVFPITGGWALFCVIPLMVKAILGGVVSGASSSSLLHEILNMNSTKKVRRAILLVIWVGLVGYRLIKYNKFIIST